MALEYTYVLDVLSFRGAKCDIDRYLVVSKARKIMAESKQAAQNWMRRD
jgi:hypothetical protein